MHETLTIDALGTSATPGMPSVEATANMAWIPGGELGMGSERHYPEERPVHRVLVDGFWIDRTPVTNAEFARFVEACLLYTSPSPRDS